MFLNVKNPVWANEEKTAINCEVEHSHHGWLPFRASPDDVEVHGIELFEQCKAGDFGKVGKFEGTNNVD